MSIPEVIKRRRRYTVVKRTSVSHVEDGVDEINDKEEEDREEK